MPKNKYNTDKKSFLQGYLKEAKQVVNIKMLRRG